MRHADCSKDFSLNRNDYMYEDKVPGSCNAAKKSFDLNAQG